MPGEKGKCSQPKRSKPEKGELLPVTWPPQASDTCKGDKPREAEPGTQEDEQLEELRVLSTVPQP